MAKELPAPVAEALAFDTVQGFFNDQQLCLRYDLNISQLRAIKQQRAFKKIQLDIKRDLEDGGEQFKLESRRAARSALRTLKKLHRDPNISGNTRFRAAMGVCALAGKGAVQDNASTQPRMVIQTNLTLGAEQKGVYSIEVDMGQLGRTGTSGEKAEALEFMEDASDLI